MVVVERSSFGMLLRRYRLAAGLSQEALAERARLSVRAISDLERGVRRMPYRDTVAHLAAALGLDALERTALQEAARGQRHRPATLGGGTAAHEPGLALLETKLAPPSARPTLVARPQLTERLHAGLHGPLTLLSAPPGSGKTTVLAAWRATPAGRALPLAWVSLDAGDNDPARFWSYVLNALDRLHPGIAAPALALLRASPAARGSAAPPIEAVLTMLVNALSAVSSDMILALDDYHEITTPAVHQGLAFLLDHRPPCLHLLLATRTDPLLPLATWRARGAVAELRDADLRFSGEEATAFLTEVMDLPLTAEAVQALETRTEGWIAGLQLAALSLRGRPAEAIMPFINAFTGSHRYVVDYLAAEVLQRQPRAVQTFLLHTCILDRLSASLCAAVMRHDGERAVGEAGEAAKGEDGAQARARELAASQALLEGLERGNLFVVALDDERRWYRYHHLFADALRQVLATGGDGPDAALLHRRAAIWFERHGLVAEAIGHALSAGTFEHVARLIEDNWLPLLARGEMQTLHAWLEALPQEVWRSRPRLCIVRAWLVLDLHTADQVARYVGDAEEALGQAAPADDSRTTRQTRGDIAAMRAVLAAFSGDPAQVIAHARTALELLERDNVLMRSVAYAALGAAYVGQGDLARAEQTLGAAIAAARVADDPVLALSMAEDQTYVQRARGQLRLAVTTGEQALAWSARHGAQLSPFGAGVHLSLADLLRERNDLDAAARHAATALELSMPLALLTSQMLSFLVLARVRRAQGDLDGALDALRKAKEFVRPHRDVVKLMALVLAVLEACEVQVWLAQGNLSAARLATAPRPHNRHDAPGHERPIPHLRL